MTANRITDKDVTEIQSQISTYASLVARGDWDTWLDLFTDDAAFLPPGEAAVQGKEEITRYVSTYPNLSTFDAEALDITGYDRLAISRGRYSFSGAAANGADVTESGKFIWIWQKGSDDSWKISQDIWNADA